MTRYADPHRCPDCNGPIEYADPSCANCGLLLRVPLAGELYRSLLTADRQLKELRALSVATAARPTFESEPATSRAQVAEQAPEAPVAGHGPQTAQSHGGMKVGSVPKVLLTLGAGCLLVAAVVFLAVTWSVLGVAGRTTVLVTLTAAAGVLTWWLLRRRLHGAAEATALVGFGLLALDLVGAKHSGWLGGIDHAGFLVLLGAVLLVLATPTALLTRQSARDGQLERAGQAGQAEQQRQPTDKQELVGAEAVAVAAAAIFGVGLDRLIAGPRELGELVTVLVLAILAAGHHRLGLRWATYGLVGCTAVGWMTLTGTAAARAVEHDTLRGLWGNGQAWPLLAAAAMAAALAALRRIELRVGGVAVAVLLVTGVVLLPVEHHNSDRQLLAMILALVLLSGATAVLRGAWRFAPSLAQAAVGGLAVAGLLASAAVSTTRIVETAATPWAGHPGDRLPAVTSAVPAGWLIPVTVVALLVATASHLPIRRVPPSTLLALPLVAALTLAAYPVPVWTVEAVLAVGAVASFAVWLKAHAQDERHERHGEQHDEHSHEEHSHEERLLPAAAYLLATIGVGLHAPWLTAGALLLAVALTALAGTRTDRATTASASGLGLAVSLGALVWTLGDCLHADDSWTVLVALVVLGLLVLGAPELPGPRRHDARLGIEVGAAATVVPLALAGVAAAPASLDATWAAVYLTVCGGFVSVLSLVRADRRQAGWLAGTLLAGASWVRLWDIGVHAPEAYALPTAAALLVVGSLRMHRRRDADTMSSLSAGLGLALVPSLLWALADPTGWRPLLLGLACLALVLVGAARRWTAPLVFGAVVGALLVLRFAAPYVDDAVPRWVLLGTAGAVLLALGATWERRLREARSVMSYMRALR